MENEHYFHPGHGAGSPDSAILTDRVVVQSAAASGRSPASG